MKILNDEKFNLLQSQASAFSAVVTAMVEASEDLKPEEITADTIIEALQDNVSETLIANLQTQLIEAKELLTAEQTALQTANDRIAALEAEVEELENLPAAEPATITSSGEPNAEKMSIAEFANKNKGNTEAILEMARKENLI